MMQKSLVSSRHQHQSLSGSTAKSTAEGTVSLWTVTSFRTFSYT